LSTRSTLLHDDPMDQLVARLAAWLREHHGRASELTRGATDAELAAIERRLRVTFPDGLRALYRWSGGGTAEGPAIMNNRHIVPLDTLVSTIEMMNGFVDDGTFSRKDWWHKSWVPFLHNGAGTCAGIPRVASRTPAVCRVR
jgi:cell wall assembly regulator SMI1